jgi:large subunit ribosomal protein L18
MSSRNETLKKLARRLRRKQHIRKSVFGTGAVPRLTVARSHRNISCQVIDDERGVTLASASTLQKDVRGSIEGAAGNKKAAAVVGKTIAERVKSLGIERVQVDRNGYRFHGCVKALVEAARSAGLKI